MTRPALRVIGTSVTLTREVRRRAALDLGFPVEFEVLDGVDCQRRGIMSPDSYDVYDQWFHSLDLLWTAVSVQPIETTRLRRWGDLRLPGTPEVFRRGRGTRPGDVLFVQPERTLGPEPPPGEPPRIAMLPTAYNMDSFAYSTGSGSVSGSGSGPEQPESWSWLLDDGYHARAYLSADPAASAVELALAVQSAGLMQIKDVGDLSIEEIDEMFGHLMVMRRAGHFGRFWNSSEDSVRAMSGSGPIIGAMWSPAYYALRASGSPLTYAAPAEGYRGWHSGLSISAATDGERLDMAYDYLNWWLDGVPGAIMARQGYYMSVVEPLRGTLTESEWNYWYGGEPAVEDLSGRDGTIARRGERREGGSYLQREARVVVWSTIMPEHNYLIRRWREFLDG